VRSRRLRLHLDSPEPSDGDVNCVIQGATNLPPTTWAAVARKIGTNPWQWLGGGTPRIVTGTPAGGRVVVDMDCAISLTACAKDPVWSPGFSRWSANTA
jgi:hypothetical protein